jgi:hypothetical protein
MQILAKYFINKHKDLSSRMIQNYLIWILFRDNVMSIFV